jgi:hypothetical protein
MVYGMISLPEFIVEDPAINTQPVNEFEVLPV